MNTFFPHCPLRQEDHYWLDTCSGSTRLHYYAAVDTGLTKRNLSSICLSGRAEPGTAMLAAAVLRWTDTQVSWRPLTTPQPPPQTNHPPPPPLLSHHHPLMLPTGAQLFFQPSTSKRRQQSERLKCRVAHSFIFNCIPYSKEDAVLFISSMFGFPLTGEFGF